MQTHSRHALKNLSVIVPVRNEEANVASLVEEICAALTNHITFEIIYIDDGSTDMTYAQLKALQLDYPCLRVIRHASPCGQSTAVRTGVKHAQYGWIATLDGDGQNDPADILRLLDVVDDSVELVGGNRRASRKDTFIKRLSSIIANGVRSRILKDSTPDTGCGLKLFSREAFLDLPYFDHMHRFLPALIRRRGGNVISVPVSHRQRQHGQSNYGTLDRLFVGIIDLLGVAWLQRRAKIPTIIENE